MFISKKFLLLSIVVILLASCAEKSDFPKLRAVEEKGADFENHLIIPNEMKPEVKYESSLDDQKIAKDEEELVIIASVAKKDDGIKVKPIMKDYSQSQTLDREAITPRGVVKVHSKYEQGIEVANDDVEIDIEITKVVLEQETITSVSSEEISAPSVTYQLETFYFDDGASNIKSADRGKIKDIVKIAKEKKAMIYVIGYSSSRTADMDYVSHKMANFKISLKRAENVADAIVKAGLKEQQVMLEALSDGRPAYLEVMPEGERLNRRVEIYIGY